MIRPYAGFLKEHTPWTPCQYKSLALNNEETHSLFLSKSPRHSVCYTLLFTLFSKLHFHFPWHEFDFYPVESQGTSWLFLWELPHPTFPGSRTEPACIKGNAGKPTWNKYKLRYHVSIQGINKKNDSGSLNLISSVFF